MADLRPSVGAASEAFATSVKAIVTVPGRKPVEAAAFWLPRLTVQTPGGADVQRAEDQHMLVIPLSDDLPQVPRNTYVLIPRFDGDSPQPFKVDSVDQVEDDHYRCLMVPCALES